MSPPHLPLNSSHRCLIHRRGVSQPSSIYIKTRDRVSLLGPEYDASRTARMHAASRADSTDSARSPLDSDPDIDEDFLASTRTLAANLEGEDDLSLLETEDDASSIASDPSSDLNQAAGANEADEDNPYTENDALSMIPADAMIGEPALEALLAEGGKDLSVERVTKIFPFPLDTFQKKALEKLVEGKSVVVCAPTGAGKTAIAEAASAATLARGQRVIYTTPLKALSNQKLGEVRRRFGHGRCGLQTGDTSLNTDADIVIMTTEILRNIMYRTAEITDDGTTASTSATREARLGDVGLIVLDEVHYLGDPSRGSVWEEAIINCPRHIQLLCMSATVKNPDDLGGWISKEHQECETIKTKFRPVPLHWHFVFKNGRGVQLVDLLDKSGKSLNPSLEPKEVMLEEARFLLGKEQGVPLSGDRRRGKGGRPWERNLQMMMDDGGYGGGGAANMQRRVNLIRIAPMDGIISRLHKLQYLPAIWFILSRKDCDLNAIKAGLVGPLTTKEEQMTISEEIEALKLEQPEAIRVKMVGALINGFASHHAGHLPGWKALIERLFQRGLCKIVFATGTLAAGLNMPARTTIISALGRKTDDGVKLMPHNELLQMAGRAGRRGYDTEGHCVVLQNRFEGAEEAFNIIKAGPEPLTSQFSASYGLVLNLLSVYSLDEARAFIQRSFGNFLQTEGKQRKQIEAANLEADARRLMTEYKETASADAQEISDAARVARRDLREAKSRAQAERCEVTRRVLMEMGLPRKVTIQIVSEDDTVTPSSSAPGKFLAKKAAAAPASSQLLPAVLVRASEDEGVDPFSPGMWDQDGTLKNLACLGADNRLMKISPVNIISILEGDEGSMDSADEEMIRTSHAAVREKGWSTSAKGSSVLVAPGNNSTAKVALKLQSKPVRKWRRIENSKEVSEEVAARRQAFKEISNQLEELRKASSDGQDKMSSARRLMRRAEAIRRDMEGMDNMEGTWITFKAVMEVLIQKGALDGDSLRILPLGLVSRGLQGQNELWLALALTHPVVLGLTGSQLAAFLGALLSSDVIRKPVTMLTTYSASDEVVNAIEALESTRMELFDLQSDTGLSRWNDSLLVDLRLAGLVEAWAAGATWSQVMADSTLDDGDVARLLMRVADLLRQVVRNQNLLPDLRAAASAALEGMDRKPIADLSF